MRSGRALAAGLPLALLALSGCAQAPTAVGGAAGPARDAPPAAAVPVGPPAAPPPSRSAPAARPGADAASDVPPDRRAVGVDVAFGGLVLGPAGPGRERVVYPWVHATGDGAGTTWAHLKLPVFSCPTGTGAGSRSPARGCTDRRVSYVDAGPDAVLVVDARQHLHLVVRAPSYLYGPGVDRAEGVAVRADAPEVGLVVDVDPGALLGTDGPRRTWRPVASARLTGAWAPAAPVGSGTAVADDGYDNRLTLQLR